MAMRLEQKQAVVAEVKGVAAKAYSVIAAEYRGLTVPEMTELRKKARESGVYLRVVKNTLARRALAETEYACMSDGLAGPLLLAFSLEEPGSAARVIRDFAKEHEQLKPRLVAFGGRLYSPEELERLASLPTKEQAIGMLLAVLKAPVEKLVRTLAEPHAKLVRTLAAVRDQKQAA